MEVTIHIPDEIAARFQRAGTDLSRHALEAFGLEEYKSGRLTDDELRRLLGFETRYQVDGFLKSHQVYVDYTMDDFLRERETLRKIGL
jgi:Uncharacterised protein family (UPF0175)